MSGEQRSHSRPGRGVGPGLSRPCWLACTAALVLATLVPATPDAQAPPLVSVAGGELRGRFAATGSGPAPAVFQGIPFARAPIGDLRWRPPMPVVPWTGTRDASTYGPPCSQIAAGWNDKTAAEASEDCLFLNVWTPGWPATGRMPVMVWFHGGANMGGSARGAGGIEPPFDGTALARRGVVVVTFNYRLGLLGFMAHPELTKESEHRSSGNYGLLDQVAVLRWVRDNIARFGGDAGNVTIFGQSAGAHDVGLLMTSPLASGLFHKAITQSGGVIISGRITPALAQAEQAGVQLASTMGAPAAGAAAFMRSLSAADVLKASPPYGGGGALRPEPNVDGYVLPTRPAEVFRAGRQAAVPLLVGSNGRERSVAGGADALRNAITEFYGDLAPRALELYGLSGSASTPAYAPHGDAAAQFATDTSFRCSASQLAAWHAATHPTYQYEFTRGHEPRGAVHSFELRYMFGMLTPEERDPVDRQLSDLMLAYWTGFAATGDPNGAERPAWPRAGGADKAYLEFSAAGPIVKSALRAPSCELFSQRLSQLMTR